MQVQAIKIAATFNSQGIANLMWAFTFFDVSAADVCDAVKRTFPDLEVLWEYREPTSWYSIDMLVRQRSVGNVDPSCSGGGGHLGTRLKRKQLRQLGYAVVSVPFWEWDALQGEEEKSEYLEGKFQFS
ncbi:hypothetical protein T484DRAFT_1774414 [Baffinella frigidus]|nr:hypothetical protein T484DRAFT_1774414 [Cryptophyta sp. CCMP2293]